MEHSDRRRQQRFQVRLPLGIRLWEGPGKASRSSRQPAEEEDTFTQDISTGGCYFLLSRRPVIGSEVEMAIVLPARVAGLQNGKVRCRGKVVRLDHGLPHGKIGVGCRIEHYMFSSPPRKQQRWEALPALPERSRVDEDWLCPETSL